MKLISMTDFVLHLRGMTLSEICKAYPRSFKEPVWKGNKDDMVKDFLAHDAIKWRFIGEYAKFLKQPLKLGMFVPCDLDGEVLEVPNTKVSPDVYPYDLERYNEAKARVLFEGFKYCKRDNNIMCVVKGDHHLMLNGKDTLEDLVKYQLDLTETAVNKIN